MTDAPPTPTAGALAVAVAAVAGLSVGATAGVAVPVGVGVVGACLAAGGVAIASRGGSRRRAAGSVTLTVGLPLAVVGAVRGLLPAPAVTLATVAGVGAVATSAATGSVSDATAALRGIRRRSGAAALVGLLAALTVSHGGGAVAVAAADEAAGVAAAATPFALFVGLQATCLAVTVLLERARPVLDDWLPDARAAPVAAADRFGAGVAEVPLTYAAAFAAQLLALVAGVGAAAFERFLDALPLFGPLFRTAIVSGVLHALAGAVAVLLACVVVGGRVQPAVARRLSPDPPAALSPAVGGVAALVGIPILTAATGETAEFAALSFAVVFLSFVGTFVLVIADGVVLNLGAPERGTGFAVGAALVFVAGVAGAERGAPPVVTFLAVAAALATWDLGSLSTDLGRRVGSDAETRKAEVVHATATLLVGAAAVAVATGALYLLVPQSVPGGERGGFLALVLVFVAVAAFQRSI
ncbi:hypothetical protein G9464_14805 [Halostella sp. JP-L12]|uniref:DUF7519 family protein n=1 Tax=Halostella TaxID=1843185 RepID=UPI0013CF3477|nr:MULTISPECIES: hypothetical protein [Halostella]NHN48856.1 hypothetical protein [Halostella sp. JP-L12]